MTNLEKLKSNFLDSVPITDKTGQGFVGETPIELYQAVFNPSDGPGVSIKYEANRKIGVFCGRIFEGDYADDMIDYGPEIGLFDSKEECFKQFENEMQWFCEELNKEYNETTDWDKFVS